MKFYMNLLLWTGELSDALLPVLEMLKKQGYDGVELPVFNPDVKRYASWAKRLKDMGLACTCVTIRTAPDNPISADAKVRALGVAKSKQTIDCCQAVGAHSLIGPYHSAIGEFSGAGPTKDEWKWGVDSMREVAEHAEKAGVMLAVEYLNRFETYLLNCAADAVRFIKDVNHPHCRTMYDTFHANIEEKNPAEAIRTVAPYAIQCHISENDRSTPGQGNVPWKQTFDALKEVGYQGPMTIEAFGLALPEIAAATKIWRRMYHSEEQLARDGLAFMKRETAARGM